MPLKPALLAAVAPAVVMIALAAPAAAQNSSTDAPVVAAPPPTKAQTPTPPPPPPPPPPPASDPAVPVVTDQPAQPTIVVPRTETPPMEPVTISPDAAYPNGFADPEDPFGNGMSLAYRQEEGFDWGLLGLLGLLGLIPLFRNGSRRRVVYVEEDDEPTRVVRRKRIDGE